MTTFNTVEELMQALDANPHLLEGMRSRLLTRELLELPEKLAEFSETTNQRLEALEHLPLALEKLSETVGRLAETVDRLAETTNRRLGALEHLPQALEKLSETVDRFVETTNRRLEALEHLPQALADLAETVDRLAETTNRRLEALERGVRRVQDDIGDFRDMMASNAVLKNATAIAYSLGLRRTRNLSQDDLLDLMGGQDISDIPRNEWNSFLIADLIMEATGDARTYYVAVEASYTADERDTRRAIRNAGYMTRFTGLPAHAVIVAARTDRRIDELVESGQVHLYRMPERSMPAE